MNFNLFNIYRIACGVFKSGNLLNLLIFFRNRVNKLNVVQFGLRGFILRFRVVHISGPQRVYCGQNDVLAISVVLNGELWLQSFLSHHRKKGIRHFVILDNGSTDNTIEFLSHQQDVTLLRTLAPYHAYENTMKRYLAKKYCKGCWCLCLDADELFDYPGSQILQLSELLSYLNEEGYNAVITQMLDMFSEKPLGKFVSNPYDDIINIYRYYDISAIHKTTYAYAAVSPQVKMHWGGIRKVVFGTNNGLTKVSLFFMDGKLEPFIHWHHAKHARLADFTCVLLHYPFVSSFYRKVSEAVASGRYGYVTNTEYSLYLKGLQESAGLHLKLPSSRLLNTVDQLVDEGFLVVSKKFSGWIDTQLKKGCAR